MSIYRFPGASHSPKVETNNKRRLPPPESAQITKPCCCAATRPKHIAFPVSAEI